MPTHTDYAPVPPAPPQPRPRHSKAYTQAQEMDIYTLHLPVGPRGRSLQTHCRKQAQIEAGQEARTKELL